MEADIGRVGTEGACTDDGVCGVCVDVENGRKAHVHAHFLTFFRKRCAQFLSEWTITTGPHCERRRKFIGTVQTHGLTPLCILADEQGNGCNLLQRFEHAALARWTALHGDDPADVIIAHERLQITLVFHGLIAVRCDHKKLANFLLER